MTSPHSGSPAARLVADRIRDLSHRKTQAEIDRTVTDDAAGYFRQVSASSVALPTAPSGSWEQLTTKESAWIVFILVINRDRDPKVTPGRVRALRDVLDAG